MFDNNTMLLFIFGVICFQVLTHTVYTNDIKFDSLHLTLLGLGEIESQNALWRKAGNMCDANNNFKSQLSQLFCVSSAQRNGTRYCSLVHNYELIKIFTLLVCGAVVSCYRHAPVCSQFTDGGNRMSLFLRFLKFSILCTLSTAVIRDSVGIYCLNMADNM